jgi:hypothetical protein
MEDRGIDFRIFGTVIKNQQDYNRECTWLYDEMHNHAQSIWKYAFVFYAMTMYASGNVLDIYKSHFAPKEKDSV